jgi:hypothetical protein
LLAQDRQDPVNIHIFKELGSRERSPGSPASPDRSHCVGKEIRR